MSDETDAVEADGAQPESAEPEWWEDPSLPWKQKPTRADLWCLGLMVFAGVWGTVMIPLGPWLLGNAPRVSASLGSRTGLVMAGALAAVGDRWWPLIWGIATLMVIKWNPLYWWAGKLWGREILDVMVRGKSERTRGWYDRFWYWTHKHETLFLVLVILPIPLPRGIICAALGAENLRLRRLMWFSVVGSFLTCGGYLALGYWIGRPAVELLDAYGRYMGYVSIALLVAIIGVAVWRAMRTNPEPVPEDADAA